MKVCGTLHHHKTSTEKNKLFKHTFDAGYTSLNTKEFPNVFDLCFSSSGVWLPCKNFYLD